MPKPFIIRWMTEIDNLILNCYNDPNSNPIKIGPLLRTKVINLIKFSKGSLLFQCMQRCTLLMKKIKKLVLEQIDNLMINRNSNKDICPKCQHTEDMFINSCNNGNTKYNRKFLFLESVSNGKNKYFQIMYYINHIYEYIKLKSRDLYKMYSLIFFHSNLNFVI